MLFISDAQLYHQKIDDAYPWYSYFLRHPIRFKIGKIILLSLFGGLIIFLLLIRLDKRAIKNQSFKYFVKRSIK